MNTRTTFILIMSIITTIITILTISSTTVSADKTQDPNGLEKAG